MAVRFKLLDAHQDALQDIYRLETGDHDRHAIMLGERSIFVCSRDRTDVSGGQEALNSIRGRFEHGADCRRDQHVGSQDRKVLQPEPGRLGYGHRVGRSGRLEPYGKEGNLPLGMLLGQGDGVHRRVDHAHVTPGRLDLKQIVLGSGHPHHIAERAEDHFRSALMPTRGDGHRLVDDSDRRNAHGAARAVDQRNLRRQQLVDREADDRMSLAAANLHNAPGPGGRLANRLGQTPDRLRIAIFVDVFHDGGSSASALPISSR